MYHPPKRKPRLESLEGRRLLAAIASLDIANASAAEGNRLAFSVVLNGTVEGGLTVDVDLVDQTATGAATFRGPNDYYNVARAILFEGLDGKVHTFSVPTWSDSVDEGPETFLVELSTENTFVGLPGQVTGTILESPSVIDLPAGETVVTHENGTVFARHGESIILQAERGDIAKLKFVGDQQDSVLAVGDLGTFFGLEVVIAYDGGEGYDEFRSMNESRVVDLGSSLYQLTNVEQINVPAGFDLHISDDDVSRISSDHQLALRLGGDAQVSLKKRWQLSEPSRVGDEIVYQATSDQAIIELTTDNAWHNPFLASDVNRDNAISNADALLVVNSLSREGERTLELPGGTTQFPPFALDVSGDGRISALDALRAINALERMSLAASELLPGSVYTIGNSLTWDTVPSRLDENPDWHIYCGQNLTFINENPEGHCVSDSTPWPVALDQNHYDWLVIQPFVGTTLEEDVSIISSWIAMQPSANIVLHTGWANDGAFADVYGEGNPDDNMRPNRAYFESLIETLNGRNPGRTISSTWAFDLLHEISTDAKNGIGPYGTLAHLYRDYAHLTRSDGRYLMHNAMRKSVEQPASSNGFDIDPAIRAYLDSKL